MSRRSSSKQRKTDEHPLFKIAWEEQQLSAGLFNYTYDDLKTPQDDTMMDVADQDYDEATVADEVLEPDPEPKGSDVQSESSSVKSKSRRRRGRFARNKYAFFYVFSCFKPSLLEYHQHHLMTEIPLVRGALKPPRLAILVKILMRIPLLIH